MPPGTVIGGYVVRRTLGSGGMGAVYLARHPNLPRDVALKVMHPGLGATPAVRARFEREAESLCRLSHPHVVDVLDRGQDGVHLWMSMQYIQGTDLAVVLESQGALDPPRALAIVDAVGQALDHAHTCGLLHRDVKPANILLAPQPDGERVYLTDFGIAKVMEASQVLTRQGEVVASFAYASPEQVQGSSLDRRTDVYALGAVLFELLTGRRAFPADEVLPLMWSVLNEPAPDVRSLRPDLPAASSGVLARALAKDPRERFGSCAELVAAARAAWPQPVRAAPTVIGRFGPPAAPPPDPSPPDPPRPAPRRNRLWLVAVAAAAALAAAAGLLVWAPWQPDQVGGSVAAGTTPTSGLTGSAPSAGGSGQDTGGSGQGTGDWGAAQFIVDEFPDLLPATLEGTGWDGATCTPTVFDIDVHADVGITCAHPNGITAEVAHYPDLAARDARRSEMETFDAPESPETWFHDGARAGVRYYSGADFEDYVWQWTTFAAQDKLLYVVILEWSGHTHEELDQAWLARAPFAGPAGG